jgi:cytochrome c-type biogenesis protein CcmH/NrfG
MSFPNSTVDDPDRGGEGAGRPAVAGGSLEAPGTAVPPRPDRCDAIPRTGQTHVGAATHRAVVGVLSIVIAGLGLSVASLAYMAWRGSHRPTAPDHWDAVRNGRRYLQAGRPDLAIQAVSGARDEAAGAGEAMTIAGTALIQLGDYRAARLALERAIKIQPDQFDAVMTLAELNLGFGNGQRGLELLESAAKLRPAEFSVWLTMAKLLNDRGDNSRAIYV